MSETSNVNPHRHSHVFLGEGHEKSERKTWAVIWLCGAMMLAEIGGGLMFGSIALVADGMHMSTHAGALLLAALAYSYAHRHAEDGRFTFGTGKVGDLAGFTSAIILAMIALLIGYESVSRLFAPVPIDFAEAIPIACLGLAVNIASAWLLSSGGRHHGHSHDHGHGQDGHGDDGAQHIATNNGTVALDVFEDGVPPHFRLHAETGPALVAETASVETIRPDGARQLFTFATRDGFLESLKKSRNRMLLRRKSGLGVKTTRLLSRSTSMRMERRTGTITCALPSFMSLRMLLFLFSSLSACCSPAPLAGSGWTL